MGLLAGGNGRSVESCVGTAGSSREAPHALLDALGMPVAEGPGEGRFIVDADGAHAKPAKPTPPSRVTIPVSAG